MPQADDSHQYINMAIEEWREKTLLMLYFIFCVLIQVSYGQDAPTVETVSRWATALDDKLFKLNGMFVIVNETYHMWATEKPPAGLNFTYEVLNETSVAEEMAKNLSDLLNIHMKALEKSVKSAEAAAAAYKWNNNLKASNNIAKMDSKDDVTYMNSKELIEKGVELVYSAKFGREVNYNFSSVHIPVEIYDGNIDILNGLNWTAALEDQFRQNQEEDQDILWQYFGSQTGFLRTYPAAQWPRDDVDLYDVRRQSWYTQGSSSPKDMLILIDTSGSTHGQSLQLILNSVKSILATLGENDYVNIVAFAEKANFVSKCFNHTAFVQANFRNKQRLIKDIDKLTAFGQADFSEAIRFAFEKFNEFSSNGTNANNAGANCNKVIMLLTDGGTDTAEDVFEKYNWPNKTVRVFTYAVGPTPNPVKALRWMACANRGYFSQIPAMGAIRAKVQEYIPVLSRPIVIKNEKVFEWGNVYLGYANLGMMTTVTLPVYNHSVDSSNQTILGVMAIDVTTDQLEAKTPFSKIGPNGYSFAINPNGYVVFHPNLRTEGKFMREPPNIDLLELEVDQSNSDLDKLRTAMIEGEKNSTIITSFFKSPDERYVTRDEADFAYMPLPNTTFRLGLCVPTYQRKYASITGDMSKFDWSVGNSSYFKILIASWNFHKEINQNGSTLFLDDVVTLLQNKPENWTTDLLYHLYWDVTHINNDTLKSFLKNISTTSHINKSDLFGHEVINRTVFLMTSGGMTLVSPPSEVGYFEADRHLRNSSIFTRALHSSGCIFVTDYTKDKRSNSSATPYIVTACGVEIKEFYTEFKKEVIVDKPAVAGERILHETVISKVLEASKGIKNVKTCEDESLLCYLVDDGGFLVATTRDDYREQIGRFMGEVDPPVFEALLSKAMFLRTVEYDFQATCLEKDKISSAGLKDFYIPSVNMLFDMLSVGWWTSKVSWAFTSFNIYSWLTSASTQVFAEYDVDEDGDDEDKQKECVEAVTQFYVNYLENNFTDTIKCQNCTRTVVAVKLKLTNLLLVVTESPCEDCSELFPPISQAPKELSETEEEDIVCEMAQNPRKRVINTTCFNYDPREDVSECGCTALQTTCLPFIIGLVLMILLTI